MAVTLALSLACASMAMEGKMRGASCAVAEGGPATAIEAAAQAVRRDDKFFRFLAQQYDSASSCSWGVAVGRR